MNWLLSPVIPNRQWPEIKFGEKRAITLDEQQCRLQESNRLPGLLSFNFIFALAVGNQIF
jgi:hypothetical protein